jgi:hypothetical protein
VHRTTIERLEDYDDPPVVFNTWITEADEIAEAAEHAPLGRVR